MCVCVCVCQAYSAEVARGKFFCIALKGGCLYGGNLAATISFPVPWGLFYLMGGSSHVGLIPQPSLLLIGGPAEDQNLNSALGAPQFSVPKFQLSPSGKE